MVSKNNVQLKDRYATKQVPHYGIRKLSVGVASVLLSTTLYMGVTAHADTLAETGSQTPVDQPANTKSGTSTINVTSGAQSTADQLASNGVNTSTGNATTDVQSKPTADQSASMATNSATPKNDVSAKAVSTVLPEQPADTTDGQLTAVTIGSQSATNFNVESDNNGSAVKPVEQSTDPAALMTNFAVTEQPVDNTHNSDTTTLNSTVKWSIHYTDESGKSLLPDSVITHNYTRTDTGDQMGNWSYVPDSVKVTGTPNAGSNIDSPTFKFDQAAGGTTFDFATWYAVAASIDGYTPNYGSVSITDQLPKNPEGLHATSTVDSGTHEFTFIYTKQPTKVTINYVDDEQGEKVVGTGTLSGKTGTEVTITPQLPKGYMLTPDKDVPSTYTVTDADNQVVTIHVQKQFVDLSATDPQAKQTRTITLHYVYGDGDKQGQPAFDDAILDVYYHRTATLDRATNQTTYGDWMWDQSQGDPSTPGYHVVSGKWTSLPQTWSIVAADVPSIKGYYADLGQNDPTNTNHTPSNTWVFPTYNNSLGGGISEGGKGATAYLDGYGYEVNPTHTIKYMPNKTTVTVNYVDDDNNKAVVGSQHWDGTTGQHIDLTLIPPENYVLTPGWVNPTSYDFDGANSSWYTVHVKHKTQDVTGQQPKDQVTKVTRLTRNHLYGDGPHKGEKFAEPDIFDLAWKRTATKDLVTNKVTFGDWQVDRDNSKNVQGWLNFYPDNGVGGGLHVRQNGYSYLGQNSHQEFVASDGTIAPNYSTAYGWRPVDAQKYSTMNFYYGPEQVNIPIYYIDADTGQEVASKTGDNALTDDDFRDGNTVAIDQSKLTSLPTTLTDYQLLPGQTFPTSYKINTFGGVKGIEIQVVKDRSVKVTFVDDDNKGAVVGTPTTITGHTGGDSVALNLTVPDKYQLADGQQLPTAYTFAKGSGDLTIHLVHQVVQREATVDVQLALVTMVDNGVDDDSALTIAVTQNHWKQLSDEIKDSKNPNSGKVFPSVKVGTLTGHVNYDLVDNKVVSFNDDWTSLNLGGQTYQMPDGTEVVNGVETGSVYSWGKSLKEQLLKYYPDTDPDYVNRPWHSYLSVNKTNEIAPDFTSDDLQAGLVGDESNALAKSTGDQAATVVKMANKTIDSNWLKDNFNDFEYSEQNGQLRADGFLAVVGLYIPYVEKTATRTINITAPDGKTTAVKQTATLAKQIDFGEDAHPAWTTGEWASYDVPTIPGYTVSQSQVAKETVTGTTKDQTVNITYTANPQTTTVVYQTEDGTPVYTTTVNGETGQTVKVSNEVPTGWHLVNGTVPSEITFGPNGIPKTVVTIAHSHATVTPDAPKTTGDKLPDNPGKTYPAGVSYDDLNKTVTGTIKVTMPDGQIKTVVKTAKLTRTADIDEVTGKVTYSDWTTGKWSAYTAPSVPGYTANYPYIAGQLVNGETEDQTIEITYTANSQTTHINYVDTQGKLVHTTTVNGQTNQTVDVPNEVPVGWKLVDGQTVPNTITFGPDGHADTSVKIEHKYAMVTPDKPQTNGTKLPDNPEQSFHGVEASDLNKTVTRTIKVTTPAGKVTTVKQTAKLTRTATVDEVTGDVSYGKWSTGQWDVYKVPTVAGYTATQTNVAAESFDEHTTDQTVDVSYTPNKQTTTVKYVDDKGKVVHTTTVDGVTNQTVKVSSEVPAGWTITKGQVPSELTFGADGHDPIEVTVVHQHVTVTPDHPQNNGTKLPDNPVKTFNGVEVNDLNKTITRTIKVTSPDGQTKTVAQTAKLTRTADVDEATGEVTYGQWTTGKWDTYEVPVLNGYTASQTSVEAAPVDENTKDQTVEVSYTPNKQSITINYVDDNGKIVHTTTVNGVTDQTVKVPNEVPAGWTITKGKVPSEITFGADGHEPVVITVAHQHVTVDSDHPQTNGTKLPDNPVKTFNGVEANDLNKTITRTINITTPDGQTKTVVQTAKLTRTADVDEVTGEVTYGKWTTGQWNAYEVPALNGYTASQTSVEATPVDENAKDQTVEVSYTPNSQSTTIKYVDDKGQTIHTTTVNGVTNQTVKVPSEVPAGWTITKGTVPSEITFGVDGHEPVVITVGHQHVTVDPDHPQNNGTKLPDNPAKTFEGVEANDLNKTIIRTIKVTTPDGKVTTTKQTAKLTRTANVDEVTGEVTYGDWTTGEWAAYDAPSFVGYAPSQTKVDKETVTSASKDTTTTITYLPTQHQISVEYVDDDDRGKVVKTDQVPGKTDQTITVTPSAPTKYELVDSNNRTYNVTSADGQRVQIHVKHHQVKTNESKTVTRTINVHTPHDGVKTVKQTATLNRDVTTDQVTGEKTYGNWTTGQWDAYTPKVMPGYTLSTNELSSANVDGRTSDQTVEVTYTADPQTVAIIYVDDAKAGAVVKTDQVAGKTDETVKVTPNVPTGYQVVGEVPGSYTLTADGHQTMTVHLIHQTKTTSESKTVMRTINVHTPHDGVKVVKQTATLTRDVTTDQVTGEKTYGDWSTTVWAHYAVPVIAGYVPSIEQVAQQVVNGTTTDQTIDVTYSSGEHTTHINYVDGDGNTVHTTTITGQTDGMSQVPNETPAGWTVVGEPVPTELTFGPDGHGDVTVTVEHQHVTVTPDQPKTSTDKLPDNPAKTYPNGVGHDDLNKTITRTIKVTTPDGQTQTAIQTAKLTRDADVDEVTGEVTYGKWTTGEWANYDAPTVPGYTPSQSEVPTTKVTDDTKDQTVTVNYTANDQTTHVTYVDGDGQTVHTTTVTGQTDQTVKVPNETPAGWTITDGQVPAEITFGSDGHDDVTVTVDHQHVTVTPDQPKTSSDKLPDNPAKTYPNGVGHSDLNKMITRTIKVTTPDGQMKTTEQKAKLTRTADVDEFTGEVTYDKWTTGEWSSYEVPTVPGYTSSQSEVPATKVTNATKDQTVTVNYTANDQTTHVTYVDGDGQTVHTTTVTGQTDQTVKVPNETPAGWTVTEGQVPTEITFGQNGHDNIIVTVEHQHVTVTSDKPQTDGTKLPDNPNQTFHGVGHDDLNKTITRTIEVTTPAGKTDTIKQTARLTRTADVDEVTGEVTYGKWTTGTWSSYTVPAVSGYTPSQAVVAEVAVTADTTDQTVTITYAANSYTTHINYVDKNGNVVHATTVTGQTDQTVKVPNEVPAGWRIVTGKVPSEIMFGGDGHGDVTITVDHQHVTVTSDDPKPNGTKLPDNPALTFRGVDHDDLNKTVTRTIKVTTPDGRTKTTEQTAKLTRPANVDEVTGEVTYGDWTTGEWAAYDAPSFVGYAPSQTKVDKETVTSASKDTTTTITYLPTQHQISVEYVDDDDRGKVVKTDQVPGKTDQTITVTPSAPTKYELVDSNNRTYNVTSSDGQTVQIHVKHHQVKTNESKTVTRTIKVHTPHDGVKTVKQTATLNRYVTTDQVTGEKTYGDWTTGQWEAYTPEVIPGYTPSINEVPNTNVGGSSSDQTVDVTYTADAQKVEIVYVDDAKDGVVVKTDQVAGKTDETVKVTPDVPAGYKVVGEVSGSYTLTANGHQTITVHLAHQTKTTSENKTVTRTINVHTPHDGVKTIKQTATLTRAVTTDQVTGEKTYGDWSATLWDHYAVPAVAGYVPSIKQVAQQVVNGTTTDQTINVTYTSGEHTTHINYVDGDGNTVHTTTIKGQTDGTAQVPNETPAGWTVVGEPVPTELAFGPDGHTDVTVTVSHKHVTVTPDQPKTSTDKLPDNPAKTYPNGVGHDDLNKIITRTIKVTTPDGQTKTVAQIAKLTRTANVDEVTGVVTYGNWTTGEWSSYDVSTVPGYTPSQSEVPTTKVTDDTKDQTVTISYTANDQTTIINYVDHNGKTVHTTVVNGHTDQTVKVPNETPAGWTIINGQVPTEITFGAKGHDDVTVTVDHQHVTVTPDKPQTDGTKLPDNPSQTFHGVSEADLNKVVTRTIEVASPARKTTTVKQTAKLTRTADVDEVTGEVTYGKWTTGAWSSYSAPTVPGYTPSQAVVAESAVYADTTDQTVKITYTADSHTTHINYVDEDGKVVHTTTVTGQTDQTIKVPNETPAGWMITTGEVPSEVTFGPDGYTDVTITVGHRHVTVTPDDPKTDGAKLPDNPALTFHDVDHDDLNKTVTRTIKLNVPGQAPQVITQTARLTRKATVDEVTGEVIYGDWTNGQWDAYEVPAVDGYTASQTTIPAVKVTSETTSQEIVVDYVAVPTAQTTPSNNQTDENQVTPEKVVKVTNGTVQETKQDAIENSGQSTIQDTKQLPQTGNDNRAGLLSLIGSSLMASLAIFGLGKKKKHEN